MKRGFIATLVILWSVFSFWPQMARAQLLTGGDLLQDCNSTEDAVRVYRCLGYISGVIDYHIFLHSLGTTPSVRVCLPKDVTAEQAAIVVMNFLNKQPAHAGFIGAPAVIMALTAQFPCAPQKKR